MTSTNLLESHSFIDWKRGVLRSLHASGERSGVLLREETFRNLKNQHEFRAIVKTSTVRISSRIVQHPMQCVPV